LLRLFLELKREGRLQSHLVLVGKKDSKYPSGCEALAELRSGEGVTYLSSVEDDDLVALYQGATALVHPSSYEGFGLTLLEAMACGTPVLANRVASIPEVVGDAALLVNDQDDKRMKDAMVRIEEDGRLRDGLIEKGRLRIQQFQWGNTAKRTAEVYRKVLEES